MLCILTTAKSVSPNTSSVLITVATIASWVSGYDSVIFSHCALALGAIDHPPTHSTESEFDIKVCPTITYFEGLEPS